ncbi:MAG TPA: DUF2726 domain-containing protein [Opitutales bacterium]|nr:DUF2726 domain-containing protein [Opitutales bacterium]
MTSIPTFPPTLWILAIVLIVLMGVVSALVAKASNGATYRKCNTLLTKAELNFLRAFAGLLPDHVLVFSKVRLCDVIEPDLPRSAKGYFRAFNRIRSKHVDFVLCDEKDTRIIGVVELDDSSHDRPDRMARDIFVDSALKQAGIPILHVKCARGYDPVELKRLFDGAFGARKAETGPATR